MLPEPPWGEGKSYEAFSKDLRPSLDWSPEHGWTVPISSVASFILFNSLLLFFFWVDGFPTTSILWNLSCDMPSSNLSLSSFYAEMTIWVSCSLTITIINAYDLSKFLQQECFSFYLETCLWFGDVYISCSFHYHCLISDDQGLRKWEIRFPISNVLLDYLFIVF